MYYDPNLHMLKVLQRKQICTYTLAKHMQLYFSISDQVALCTRLKRD